MRRDRVQRKGSGKWREAPRRRPLQTATQPGGMPNPPPPHEGLHCHPPPPSRTRGTEAVTADNAHQGTPQPPEAHALHPRWAVLCALEPRKALWYRGCSPRGMAHEVPCPRGSSVEDGSQGNGSLEASGCSDQGLTPPSLPSQRGGGCCPPPPRHGLVVCIWMHPVNGTGNGPSPGHPTPGVVKQDKSSGGSVDTTKTRSGPQRVRMSSGERPIGAANGKQSDTKALCQPPPPPLPPCVGPP